MFIGHFAPAIAAAAHKDAPSLPILFVAGQLIDWGFFALLLTGHEALRLSPGISAMNPMDLHHMPYTHSLIGAMGFGVAMAILMWAITRRWTGALIAGGVVVSHWFLDLLVHVPDLTLVGNPPKLGFGLWNYPWVEMPLELLLTFGALWYFVKRRPTRPLPLITLVVVLLALQAINWFGPPPTEVNAGTSYLAFFAFGLATLAAWWVTRSLSGPQESAKSI
jgi:hypothetical protein